jgi:hypothetical protein
MRTAGDRVSGPICLMLAVTYVALTVFYVTSENAINAVICTVAATFWLWAWTEDYV